MAKKKKVSIKNVKFGKGVKIIEPVNLYGCEIGKNCFIGPYVEIQNNVYIGDNTRISSHSFICELVKIGNGCFISHGVMFTNDLFKSGTLEKNSHKFLPTKIGNNVLIGSNSTILPVNIVSGCIIGAGSVVTKDLSKKGIYVGNPAKFVRKIS
tara:strand:+ start:12150 stop:12608 length:459 start_codon:yes stop_codon:yes gene_type:complete